MPRREHKGGAAATTLNALMTVGAGSFTVASGGGAGYPTGGVGPFYVCLDAGTALEEKVLCSARSGDVFTVAGSGRGVDDTTAAEHAVGAAVTHVFAALEADEANAHINTGLGVHGRTSQLASIADAETFTNKTISGLSNTLSAIPQSAVTNLTADLAAKFDDSQVHSSWLTPLGTAMGTGWSAALAAALGSGWSTMFGVTPGTGWSAAVDANLDADAASLLANIANGWVAILQAAPGSGWAAELAATFVRPNTRIATDINTTNSGAVTTTETSVQTIAASLVSGRTYRVRVSGNVLCSQANVNTRVRIREDSVSGTILQNRIVTNGGDAAASTSADLEVEFTAGSTGSKTFAVTIIRETGTGTHIWQAGASTPAYLYVDYVRN